MRMPFFYITLIPKYESQQWKECDQNFKQEQDQHDIQKIHTLKDINFSFLTADQFAQIMKHISAPKTNLVTTDI